jgi:hypothetical protein
VSWIGPTVLLIIVFTIEPAFAAGTHRSEDKRQSQEKAARKACLTGDYTTGISILADMFVEYRDPVFVYNQGRCLEQNARYKEAIARFEEFIRLGDTTKLTDGGRETAQKHIEDCKAKVAEENPVAAPQPVAQPLPQPLPQAALQPETVPQVVDQPKPQPEPTTGGSGLLIGGIVTGSVGVGAVVAGYFLGRKSNDMVNQMQTKVDNYTDSRHSSQQTYKTLAWVSYGVGAACVAGGVVMIAIRASRRASPTQTGLALVPAIGPGQGGILLRGGF